MKLVEVNDLDLKVDLFCFGPRCMPCGILVLRPGIEPRSPVVEAWSPKGMPGN